MTRTMLRVRRRLSAPVVSGAANGAENGIATVGAGHRARARTALAFLLVGSIAGLLLAGPPRGANAGASEDWVELKGGLRYLDLEIGEGPPAMPGRTVQVHYTGWLADGTLFQSSRQSGAAFTFELGGGQVIQGWERGVRGMRAGGKRRLEIPPKLAYGRRGRPPLIPENATLTFEIELLSVR